MLAAAGQALIDALKAHREIRNVVRTVDRLPQLELDELLRRYAADAPAFYVLPGVLRVVDGEHAVLTFTVAGVVRNVGGPGKAFAGDAIDIGADHLLLLATRAIHAQRLGDAGWNLQRAELEDDPLFDKTGIAAVSMTFETSPIELASDWGLAELASFKTFHADIDIPPLAGDAEYASWLQTPPNYASSRPDLQLDQSLQGA